MSFQSDSSFRRLPGYVAALVPAHDRPEAARRLAQRLGGEDLLVFVPDHELGALLPAPGFAQTLPQGRRWHAFLQTCSATSVSATQLPTPPAGAIREIVAVGSPATAVLAVLGGRPDHETLYDVASLLPLLAASFEGEQATAAARSQSTMAREAAREAAALGVSIRVHAVRRVVGYWDPQRLDQLVSNLVSNALKYGNRRPVTVTLDGDDAMARVAVQDSGVGIEPQDLKRILGRFERAEVGADSGGLGLGLYISAQIVALHGGRIWAESEPGAGSTFTVELPRNRVIATPGADQGLAHDLSSATARGGFDSGSPVEWHSSCDTVPDRIQGR